ncbi:DNA helicase [Sarracenia purpurea var. burkii]
MLDRVVDKIVVTQPPECMELSMYAFGWFKSLAGGAWKCDGFTISKSMGEIENGHNELLNEVELAAAAEEKETHSFEVDSAQVEQDLTLLYYHAVQGSL